MRTDSIQTQQLAATSGVPSVSPLAAPASSTAPEHYGSGLFGPAYVREGQRSNGESFPLYAADGSLRSRDAPPGRTALADARAIQAPEEGEGRASRTKDATGEPLSRENEALLRKLQARDAKVRNHEAAHVMAAGGQAGAPTYTYQTGPDGKRYAIGGSVNISMWRTGDAEQDARQAQNVQRAAMATGEPSSRDMQTAMRARARDMDATRGQWGKALEAYAAQGALPAW